MIPNTRRNKVREIEFKGKDSTGIMNYDWFYGSLDTSFNKDFPRIVCKDKWGNTMLITVDGETVGQYTGVDDSNKRKIFENDIVDLILPYKTIRCKVVFEKGHFKLVDDYDSLVYYISPSLDMEVLGNIFDNPELMEESNDN